MNSYKIVKVKTDENDYVSVDDIKATVKKYGKNVVAIFGSAPSYSTGQEDPIWKMAEIALQAGIGFHVDSCLGGFVINNLEEGANYLKIPGVTSLSADTHKNGFAPKGSSVLIARSNVKQDIIYYSAYSIPDWKGGVYGTPRDPGSQSSVPPFLTFLTMLAVGKRNYYNNAVHIQNTTESIKKLITKKFSGDLRVLGDSKVNVIAFKINESLGLERGATYALVHEMKNRGFILNSIKGDAAHICVTARFAKDTLILDKLFVALKKSLDAVKDLDSKVKNGEAKMSGDAPLYCTVDDIVEPNPENQKFSKYIENVLVGPAALDAIVRHYFKAQQNPFI